MLKRNRSVLSFAAVSGLLAILLAGCAEQPKPVEAPPTEAAKPPEPPKEAPPAEPEKKEPEAAKAPEEAKPKPVAKAPAKKSLMNPSALKEQAPAIYKVKFATSKGDILIEVDRSWAPLGADRFYNLVKNGFYDGCKFFRIVNNFIVQVGMHPDPKVSRVWQDANFKDDPVTKTNRRGSITFATAGPNTRTTQIFINTKTTGNAFLDTQGFAPFGRVLEGMEVVDTLYAGYGEAPDQTMIRAKGNAYLDEKFPKLDYIESATIVE
jgi:peptidyl-prolyl cis-trans isomerase A (cyclophilin A)